MMVTNVKSAGKRHFSDVHYRRTSLTPGRHATTTTTNMDQKELEDRLAAAEALSSLGLPTFRDSNPAPPVENVPTSAPKGEKVSKARAKTRAGRGRDEHGTGRETKSRSARGRGARAGKVVQDDVGTAAPNPAVSSPALTVSPEVRSDSSLLQQLTTPRTSSSRGGGGTGRGGGKGGRGSRGGTGSSKSGTKLAPSPAVVVVPVSDRSVAGGVGVSVSSATSTAGPTTLHRTSLDHGTVLHPTSASVGSVAYHRFAADATSSATAVPIPHLVIAGGNRLVLSTPSTFASTASPSSLPSSFISSASSSTAAAAPPPSASAATTTTTATAMLSARSALLQTSTPVPIRNVTSAAPGPGAPTDNLTSPPALPSLSLPSFSLGSTGLPNLASIPNLPSLPISSLQLGTLEGSTSLKSVSAAPPQDSSPASQLSPHSRDGDEKSLPLKKRRIIESSASSSSSQPGPMSPMPPSPLVTNSPAGAAIPVLAVASASSAAPDKSPEGRGWGMHPDSRRDSVTSPSPVPPVNMLCQMLPPDMYRQLISEINTAITPDDDGDVPLHIAVVHENEVMVKKLIQLMALAGQRVDRYNKQHQTPLHLAVKLTSLSSMKMLMEAGADPNLVDSVGLSSTHMAVQGRDIDCLEGLLQWSKYPCNLNNRNFEGLAPLHSAIINNDLEIGTRLLDQGADVNIMDGKSGRTALFHAAEGNQKAAVELLLARSADPEIANYAGVVPAMAAQGRSHTTVARLLARALDEGGEEEKAGEKGEKSENQYRYIPFEYILSEDSSRSPRQSVPELRRALSGQVAVQVKQQVAPSSAGSSSPSSSTASTKAQVQGQAQAPASSVLSILQSSSALGNAARGRTAEAAGTGGAAVPPPSLKTSGMLTASSAAQPPAIVTKAMHQQLPALITKLTSSSLPGATTPPSSSAVSVPKVVALTQRRNSSFDSSPRPDALVVAPETGERSSEREGGAGSQAVGSALRTLVTGRRSLANRQAGAVPMIIGEGDKRVLTESLEKRGFVQAASHPTESPAQASGQAAGGLAAPAAATASASQREALARLFCMQMKAIADKQSNGGVQGPAAGGVGGGVVNVPLIPGVVPAHGLRAAAPPSSSSAASPAPGGAAAVLAPQQRVRMAPLQIPSAPGITTTSAAVMGMRVAAAASPALLASLSSAATPVPAAASLSAVPTSSTTGAASTPSEAHAQPTRPLLLLRSTEGGRRMGSVELRNVTPDALRALQQSSSNLVNQAVGSSAAGPSLQHQHQHQQQHQQQQLLQSFLTVASSHPGGGGSVIGGGGGGGGGVAAAAVETNRVPPLSNHVSRESSQPQQIEQQGYSSMGRADDGWDEEPKDLSLKSKKRKKEKETPEDSLPSFPPKPLQKAELPRTFLLRDSPGSRTADPSDRSIAGAGPSQGGKGERKRRSAAGDDDPPKPAKERKSSKTKTAKSQLLGDTGERKKTVTGPGGQAAKEAVGGAVQGMAEKFHKSTKSAELNPVIKIPGGASVGQPVFLNTLQPPANELTMKNAGPLTSSQGKTAAGTDGSTALDLGSKRGHSERLAKFRSDQNDNVKERLPLGTGPVVQNTDGTKIKRDAGKPVEEQMKTN